MGLFDTLLGRTKPVQSNLDGLFAIPSASITLQSATGQVCSGHAGVCYKPPSGQGFVDMQSEVVTLLSMDKTGSFKKSEDSFGYQWLVIDEPDISELVTQVHTVNSSLSDAGWGPQLLCSVFGLTTEAGGEGAPALAAGSVSELNETAEAPAPPDHQPSGPTNESVGPGRLLSSTAYLVYLFKRGTFYPFVPDGKDHRNLERELKLKSLLADDLTVEPDLDRWFPLWNLPVG